MTSAQAALVDNQLIDNLNALRIRHDSVHAQPLAQVKFRAQGLRKNRPVYLAISAMIAVLDNQPDVIRSAAVELTNNYPGDLDSRMNVLRSFSALGMRSDIVEHAGGLCDDFPRPGVIDTVLACLSNAGALNAAHDLAHKWMPRVATLPLEYSYSPAQRAGMVERLLASGVDEPQFIDLIDTAREKLASAGWHAPGVAVSPVAAPSEEAGALAIVEFFIDAGSERDGVLDLEDEVMDEVMSNDAFRSFKVLMAVVAQSSEA